MSTEGDAVMEHVHVISVNGPYQIVAFTRDAPYDPANIIGYGVTTTAGTALRHALTAEEARDWLQRRMEEEFLDRHKPDALAPAPIAPVSKTRTRRVRR